MNHTLLVSKGNTIGHLFAGKNEFINGVLLLDELVEGSSFTKLSHQVVLVIIHDKTVVETHNVTMLQFLQVAHFPIDKVKVLL